MKTKKTQNQENQENQQLNSFTISRNIYFNEIAQKFNLKQSPLLVLIGMANHYNPNKFIIFPRQDYLAKNLNMSEATVVRAVKELSDKGLILKSRKRSGNIYKFTNLFFQSVNLSVPKCQIDGLESVNLTVAYNIERKQIINNKTYISETDPTYQNNDDAILKNTDGEKQEQILQKLRQLNFHKPKSLIFKYGVQKLEKLLEIVENKKDVKNKGAYLRSILDLPDITEIFGKTKKPNEIDMMTEKTQQYLINRQSIKTGSPMEFTEEAARLFVESLPTEARRISLFAEQLRIKWGWPALRNRIS